MCIFVTVWTVSTSVCIWLLCGQSLTVPTANVLFPVGPGLSNRAPSLTECQWAFCQGWRVRCVSLVWRKNDYGSMIFCQGWRVRCVSLVWRENDYGSVRMNVEDMLCSDAGYGSAL